MFIQIITILIVFCYPFEEAQISSFLEKKAKISGDKGVKNKVLCSED